MAGTPTPYRAKDGRISYSVRFRVQGHKNPVKETFGPFDGDHDGSRALAEATKFRALVVRIGGEAARARRAATEHSARTMPTLATWLDTYLAEVASHGARGTAPGYRSAAERSWLPTLGPLTLDAITRADVQAWVTDQRRTETARSASNRAKARKDGRPEPPVMCWSPKSIKNAHTVLSQALAAAVEAELIVKNVARGVELPSDTTGHEMTALSEAESARIMAALDPYWLPLVATILGTGLRWGEATALRVGDVDLDGPVAVLRVQRAWKKDEGSGRYLGGPKTSRSLRTVSLGTGLAAILRPLTDRGPDEWLFTSRQGRVVSRQHFRERVWLPALAKSGIGKHVRLHDLRHSHAAQMIARGMDPKTLQMRLGHQSAQTTMDTYGHLRPDVLAYSAQIADAAAAPALPQIEAE